MLPGRGALGDPLAAGLSPALVRAAQDEIAAARESGDKSTACDLYLERVLNRAGLPFPHFLANDFDQAMRRALPNWKMAEFLYDSEPMGRDALRAFLDDFPDGTALLAQWPREGGSGHVALIVKEAIGHYSIYQAQLNLAPPTSKPVKIEGLLYPPNQWGSRLRLRIFFESADGAASRP